MCDIVYFLYYHMHNFVYSFISYPIIQMSRKLLFMFDLTNKPLSTYWLIRTSLEQTYGKDNILEILNTTYIIKHQTDTPAELVAYMVEESLIKGDDKCYCDLVSNNAWFFLPPESTNFIQS